jgi:cell division cycle 20, cofactor of APC complex
MLETRRVPTLLPSCFKFALLSDMAFNPRTPARHRARSDVAKTPLTPSHLLSALNNVTISSPTKTGGSRSSKYSVADITNPFITKSRPVSPMKRTTSGSIQVSESLQRQASSGVIRRGGVESKLDVVSRDYVPPPPRPEAKRSRSTPAMVCLPPGFCLRQEFELMD